MVPAMIIISETNTTTVVKSAQEMVDAMNQVAPKGISGKRRNPFS